MPARMLVTGFVLVVLTVFTVYCIELFVPLSAKAEMNTLCRSALLRMETEGGLSDTAVSELTASLQQKGFNNIQVTATAAAMRGEELRLAVSADFPYVTYGALFDKAAVSARMIYDRTSVGRKVVN